MLQFLYVLQSTQRQLITNKSEELSATHSEHMFFGRSNKNWPRLIPK